MFKLRAGRLPAGSNVQDLRTGATAKQAKDREIIGTARPVTQAREGVAVSQPKDNMIKMHIGKAGEKRVESELLLRGYKIYIPVIDDGIDIKCNKAGHNFNIQIKTRNRHPDGTHIFIIDDKKFPKYDSSEMRYVFALLHDSTFDFVVMPSKDVLRMVNEGHMTKNESGYQARFETAGDCILLGKNRKDMSSYWNDWDL